MAAVEAGCRKMVRTNADKTVAENTWHEVNKMAAVKTAAENT